MRRLIALLAVLTAVNVCAVGIGGGLSSAGDSSDSPAFIVGGNMTSTANSSTNALTGDAVFTGTWESTMNYSVILVAVKPDVSSATNGFIVQFSSDQSTVVSDDTFTVFQNGGKTYSFQPAAEYFRIVYTNGASPQTTFDLHTQLKATYVKPSSHRIGDSIIAEDDAELAKSALTGEDDTGNWQNVGVTSDGNLTISDESSGLSIARGNVTGATAEHKFGNAPDFDTGDGEVTIWDGAEDNTTWENMRYDYSTSADIDSISSSDTTDTQVMEIQGLGAATNLVVQMATLDGTNRVALGTSLYRVFRTKNTGASDLTGHVFVYPNTPITAGIPIDNSKIRVVVQPENNQTEMAVYTIPAGKTGYMRSFDCATSGGTKLSNYIIRIYARSAGGVFQLKKKLSISDTGTSVFQYTYQDPAVYEAGTDLEMTGESIASPAVSEAAISGGFDLVLIDD